MPVPSFKVLGTKTRARRFGDIMTSVSVFARFVLAVVGGCRHIDPFYLFVSKTKMHLMGADCVSCYKKATGNRYLQDKQRKHLLESIMNDAFEKMGKLLTSSIFSGYLFYLVVGPALQI